MLESRSPADVLCITLLAIWFVGSLSFSSLVINGLTLPSVRLSGPVWLKPQLTYVISHGEAHGNGSFPLIELTATSVVVSNVTLRGGSSVYSGGCLLLHNVSRIMIEYSHFVDCSARTQGGAIAAFPYDSLFLHMQKTVFERVSTVCSESCENSHKAVASGSAIAVIFRGNGTGSQIFVRDVSINEFSHFLNISEASDPFERTGGAIVFAWEQSRSGDSVVANFENLSFTNGATAVLGQTLACENYNVCSSSGLGVLLFFSGNLSGNGLSLSMKGISLENVTFLQTAGTNALGSGAMWNSESSGHGTNASMGRVTMVNCMFGGASAAFGLWWLGTSSGDGVGLAAMDSIDIYSSIFSSSSAFLSMLWAGASSGSLALGTLVNAQMSVASSSIGYGCFLLEMSWLGELSGSFARLTLTNSTARVENSYLDYGAVGFGMQWSGSLSGCNSTFLVSDSDVSLYGAILKRSAQFAKMDWLGVQSGNDSAITIEASQISIDGAVFADDASMALMVWMDSSSGFRTAVEIAQSTLVLCNAVLETSATVFSVVHMGATSGNTTVSMADSNLAASITRLGRSASLFFITWYENDSGAGGSFFLQGSVVRLHDVYFDNGAAFLFLAWIGERSGNVGRLGVYGSNISLSEVLIGSTANIFYLGVFASSSGMSSSLLFCDSMLEVLNCSLSAASSVVRMHWESDGSGSHTSFLFEASVIKVVGVDIARNGSLFAMGWLSSASGNAAIMATHKTVVDIVSSSFSTGAAAFYMAWETNDHGTDSSLILSDTSLSFVSISVSGTALVALVWLGGGSASNKGSGSHVLVSNSSVLLESCELGVNAFVFVMDWNNRHDRAVIGERSSSIVVTGGTVAIRGLVNRQNGTIVFVNNPGPQFELSLSSTTIIDSAFQSLAQVFANDVVADCAFMLMNITMSSASLQSLLQLIGPSFVSCHSTVARVSVVNSSITGVQVEFLPTQGSSSASNGSLAILVNDFVGLSSNMTSLMLIADDSPADVEVQVIVANQTCHEGAYSGLQALARSSSVSFTALMERIFVMFSLVELLVVDGPIGRMGLSHVTLESVRTEAPLCSVGVYKGYELSILSVEHVVATGVSALSERVPLLKLTGGVSLQLLGPCVFVLRDYLSSAAVIEGSSAVGAPTIESYNNGQLTVHVDRAFQGARRSVGILSLPVGAKSIDGYFIRKSHYNPYSEHVSFDFVRPTGFVCPVGYTFDFELDVPLVFYLPYTEAPFNCLEPLDSTGVPSCQTPSLSTTAKCSPCTQETVSFFRGTAAGASAFTVVKDRTVSASTSSLTNCRPCPSSLVCGEGPADATVTQGHWTLFLPEVWQSPSWEYTSFDDVVVACPPGACESPLPLRYKDGEIFEGSLCAEGRDQNSPLCALCWLNASASFFSSKCVADCAWGPENVGLIAGAIVLVGGYVAFLLCRPLSPQSPWIRIVVYYYSVLNLLLTSSDGSIHEVLLQLATTLSTLGLYIPLDDASSAGPCAPGFQPIHMLLLRLSIPLLITALLCCSFIVRRLFRRDSRGGARLVSGLFAVLLLSYSSISGAVFAFLPCVDVPLLKPDLHFESRLFRNAVWLCWSSSPIAVAAVGLGVLLVFAVPIGLFVWQGFFPSTTSARLPRRLLSHVAVKLCSRQRTRRAWKGVTLVYLIENNLRIWYWDAFLFLRRAILELMNVLVPTGTVKQFWLLSLNLLFFGSHAVARPYTRSLANVTEFISLFLLTLIGALNLPSSLLQSVPTISGRFRPFLKGIASAQSWVALGGFVVVTVPVLYIYSTLFITQCRKWRCRQPRRTRKVPSVQLTELEEPLVSNDKSATTL